MALLDSRKGRLYATRPNSELSKASTWAPKVCKIMAFMAIIRGLGLLFCILLGFRYVLLLCRQGVILAQNLSLN